MIRIYSKNDTTVTLIITAVGYLINIVTSKCVYTWVEGKLFALIQSSKFAFMIVLTLFALSQSGRSARILHQLHCRRRAGDTSECGGALEGAVISRCSVRQPSAAVDRGSQDLGHTVRNAELGQKLRLDEGARVNAHHRGRDVDAFQHEVEGEDVVVDHGDRGRQGDVLQGRAVVEGVVVDGSHAAGHHDRLQLAGRVERVSVDDGDRGRNQHADHVVAELERFGCDASSSCGQLHTSVGLRRASRADPSVGRSAKIRRRSRAYNAFNP